MKPFYFDTNQVFGIVSSEYEWERYKKRFQEAYPTSDVYNCRCAIGSESAPESFGLYSEHTGRLTLGEWFDSLGQSR